jgi:hypothetical protein
MLRTAKDDLGLKVPGMNQILYESSKVYIGQTGRSTEARCKEHMRRIYLEQPEKSAVAEHRNNSALHKLQQYFRLHKAAGYMGCLIKEAIEI